MFNCSDGVLFISKYLLFIGYIQYTLTVNFYSIFTIVKGSLMTNVAVKCCNLRVFSNICQEIKEINTFVALILNRE